MGNLVMKCCVGVAAVRVMRPNGRIDHFDFPVTALEVMQRYPQHLVIHSNYIERDCSLEQQRRKVTIVRPENSLLPGHEYILYPIPTQYREVVAQTFAKQLCSMNPEEEQHRKQPQQQQPKRKVVSRSQAIAATRQHLATILQASRDSSKVGVERRDIGGRQERKRMEGLESSAKIEGEGNVNTGDDDGDDDEEFSFYCSASWKPSLQSIPESPNWNDPAHVRRHSFSALPLESC